MKITAKLRHLRMSPRKVRLVANLVRGMDVIQAKTQLKFMSKRAAGHVLKLLESAIANAKNNFNIQNENNLFIFEIRVDQGPSLKRWRARAMGRAARILKRTSHITLVLDEKESGISGKKNSKKEKLSGIQDKNAGIVETEHILPSSQKPDKTAVKDKKPAKPAFAKASAGKPEIYRKREKFSKSAPGRKFSRLGNKIFRRKSI
ncbi:50S ribosomal protein L22 [bacterium]|nr:50S ribosomal protein L22 [bacterium]|tara:strand:- start:2851 stop:3462 length:612 start_codon:yes stop_codon:yes gene_type:complete